MEKTKRKYTKEELIRLFTIVVLLASALSFVIRAMLCRVNYHEIDSYILPAEALEYRQTLILTQADIDSAKADFPYYYEYVDDFDSLRCSRLTKITEDKWIAFYFPLYTYACMPLKLLFQLVGFDQMRAFTLMNAAFVIFALIFVYKKLNVSPGMKLLAVSLLAVSPIFMYIQYVSAEAFIFSMIMVAMVLYTNGYYKTSALLIALASMPNPTVMGIGIVMVAEYFVKMIRGRKEVKIFSKKNILRTLAYGSCYVPCLIPFIFNYLTIGSGNPTSGGAALYDYPERFFSYLFDTDIGFFSFAPLVLILFFVLIVISLVKKKFNALVYGGFVLAPVAAYSLMSFITCVPIYCARYVMWTYPTLAIGTVMLLKNLPETGKLSVFGKASAITAAVSSFIFLPLNYTPINTIYPNNTSEFLLEYFPEIINPYRELFYFRSGGYTFSQEIECPQAYYSPKDDTLRKLLIKSTDEYKQQALSMVKGDEKSLELFAEKVNSLPSDNKFHYVNISPFSGISVKAKNNEEMGYFSENKLLLDIKEGFDRTYKVQIEDTRCYKIEVNLNPDSLVPGKDEKQPVLTLNPGYSYSLNSFEKNGDYSYVLFTYIGSTGGTTDCDLGFITPEGVKIDEVKLTLMNNERELFSTDEKFTLSGKGKPETKSFEIFPEHDTSYRVQVNIENPEDIAEGEGLECSVYYPSSNSITLDHGYIDNATGSCVIFVGDTTYAKGPVSLRISGETEKPIRITGVTAAQAE